MSLQPLLAVFHTQQSFTKIQCSFLAVDHQQQLHSMTYGVLIYRPENGIDQYRWEIIHRQKRAQHWCVTRIH